MTTMLLSVAGLAYFVALGRSRSREGATRKRTRRKRVIKRDRRRVGAPQKAIALPPSWNTLQFAWILAGKAEILPNMGKPGTSARLGKTKSGHVVSVISSASSLMMGIHKSYKKALFFRRPVRRSIALLAPRYAPSLSAIIQSSRRQI
ncbi:hypothetical protein MTO96_016762 [Rhipicephalus appendiculatus]